MEACGLACAFEDLVTMLQGNVNVALNELRQMDVAHLGGVDPAKAWHLLADHRFFDGFDRCQDIESFRFRALRNAIVVIVESGRRRGRQRNGSAVIYRRCLLRSEEHTSELQSLMRNSYAVFCLKKT